MADSLGEAERAADAGELGEALVHLWNAYEQSRWTADERVRDRIVDLTERVATAGDEGERAEAERLLAELDRTDDDAAVEPAEEPPDEDWVVEPAADAAEASADRPPADVVADRREPDRPDEVEEEPRRRSRVPVGALIWLAFIVYAVVRVLGD